MLRVTGQSNELTRQWMAALFDLVVRHPNTLSTPVLTLVDAPEPVLRVELDYTSDSRDPIQRFENFVISNVTLSYFPGTVLARKWFAAAWAGYVSHEALELVTIGGLTSRPLDPHESPYPLNPWNRGLRDGLPVRLTPESLIQSLAVVMPIADAKHLAVTYGQH